MGTLSSISCESPDFSVASVREMTVPIHVGVGAYIQSEGAVFFTYHPEPAVNRISPSSGPVTGSEISVAGEDSLTVQI